MRHIHQEIDHVCVLCGADLTPPEDSLPDIGVVTEETVDTKEQIS